jgi:hypothetical protein
MTFAICLPRTLVLYKCHATLSCTKLQFPTRPQRRHAAEREFSELAVNSDGLTASARHTRWFRCPAWIGTLNVAGCYWHFLNDIDQIERQRTSKD